MRKFAFSILALFIATQTASFGHTPFPDDPLAGIDRVEMTLVLGGALSNSYDKSLFADDPQLASVLRPCIENLIRQTLAQRSILAQLSPENSPDASQPSHELVVGVFGRPITIDSQIGEVMSYYIELEFFVDVDVEVEVQEPIVETSPSSNESDSICSSDSIFVSSHLNTVLRPDLRGSIMRDIAKLLKKFSLNPAYCSGESNTIPRCAGDHKALASALQACQNLSAQE